MPTTNISKLRKQAVDLIRTGEKVYHYRKDILEPEDLEVLKTNTRELETLYKDKDADPATVVSRIEAQDAILKKTGGTFYPNRFISENVETIMVVAIVIIAFRIFFFQPFVIPTSSMYPTYYGMTPKAYTEGESSPNPLSRLFAKVFRGASHYSVLAENNGEISIPLSNTGRLIRRQVPARKWFGLLPTVNNEYLFYVGNTPHTLRVPAEFDLSETIVKVFFAGNENARRTANIGNQRVVQTGVRIRQDEPILQFDILMGDALFVNRMWYHFFKPKSGDPFVFRTETFAERDGYPFNVGEDKFYIKRLVGEPGQTLQIEGTTLLQDGQPATGAAAFDRNATMVDDYPGYQQQYLLGDGESYTIPEGHYFAMGDNSANSQDSRYFGPVPEKTIIGSAFFIYYPFTKRWGPAE